MKKVKLIIEIDENLYNFVTTKRPNGMYNNFDDYDLCVVSKCVRNGKLLQTELEEIKETFCDMRDGYPKITDETLTVREVIEVIDKRIKETNNDN